MEQNLQSLEYRRQLIAEINGQENQRRQEKSQSNWDIYTGNIRPYVEKKLQERFSQKLVKEIPIVSSINILKKIVNQKASIYKQAPERNYTNLNDDQLEVIYKINEDMRLDAQMLDLNKLYELEGQTHALIEPVNGKLRLRPVKCHQINVKPSDSDPEVGEVFIFSSYDKSENTQKVDKSDGSNQQIADINDYDDKRYIVWSKSFHFVMNQDGVSITDDVVSPLLSQGVVPVIEICSMKDFTYWKMETNEEAEFCVNYNMHQSLLAQICELQSFGQMYLKTTAQQMPESIEVGPNRIVRLVIDPNVEGGDKSEFGFASPNSDIAGAQAFNESLLSQFLSSQGVDPGMISGNASTSVKYNSGTERLLAMIEKFEASRETMDLFKDAERGVYKIIKAWHNVLRTTDQLNEEYNAGSDFPDDSTVSIKYAEPNGTLSEGEKLDILERKRDLGIIDQIGLLEEYYEIDREDALEKLSEMENNIV